MHARLIPVFGLLLAGSFTIWGYVLVLNGMREAAKAAAAQLIAPEGAMDQYMSTQAAAIASVDAAPTAMPIPVGPPPPAANPPAIAVPLGPYFAPQYDYSEPREFPRDIRSGL